VPAPSFDEFVEDKSLFKNKGVLSPHFVPETLLYRENELRSVMRGIAPALRGQRATNMFLYGKTGTGKTVCVKHVLDKLMDRKSVNALSVYMNCRVYDSRYKTLQKCVSEFQPGFAKTGYSFAILYEEFLDWIEGENKDSTPKHVVIALDEIDLVKDLDSLIYSLTRSNDDLKKGSVSILGVSNKVDFKTRLSARSKSSLCETELVFNPYNAEQLQGILKQRVSDAFKEGAVTDSAINLAAAIAASENGDARYALTLLMRAGELAEKKSLKKIEDKDVEASRKAADEDAAFEVIGALPVHQQLLLYALATLPQDARYKKLLEEGGEKFYFSGEVYEQYRRISKRTGKDARTARWFREYLNDLEGAGLITTQQSGKGVRGHTTLIKPAYDSRKIKRVIDKMLFSAD